MKNYKVVHYLCESTEDDVNTTIKHSLSMHMRTVSVKSISFFHLRVCDLKRAVKVHAGSSGGFCQKCLSDVIYGVGDAVHDELRRIAEGNHATELMLLSQRSAKVLRYECNAKDWLGLFLFV
jgi:hypothetical protein